MLLIYSLLTAILFGIFKVNVVTVSILFAAFLFLLFVIYFFRVPKREIATLKPNEIFSSADGKVVIIKEVEEKEFLKEKVIQVSVFMSVFNIHINYFPVKGKVIYYNYHPGNYMVAWHPKSSEENERTSVAMETDGSKRILIRQIAGYVARRIVCYVTQGQQANAGEQLGFIKFGSRVDFFLPLDSEILVKKGDKVKACQTVIARLK